MREAAIILAAGAGTRMKSKNSKVVHEILGKKLIDWVVDAARSAGIEDLVTVVGHRSDQVIEAVSDRSAIAHQKEMLGTADAVSCAMEAPQLADLHGSVVVLYGDTPLISSDTIRKLLDIRNEKNASCVVLTMRLDDPFGYGRIIRGDTFETETATGEVLRIVEQKDASEAEARVCECNSGIYCFDADDLRSALAKIEPNNAQGELYVTDALEIMKSEGKVCVAYEAEDPTECLGINSRYQLAEATSVMQTRINRRFMDEGVTMMAPELVWIGPDVKIDRDVVLMPNVWLFGNTSIGEDSIVGPNTRLTDTFIGCGCTIDETVAIEARVDDGASTGPRAYLRPEAHLCEGAKAGTHVEIKKSTIGKGSKVPHLSYIGDTTMGQGVNIGAGSITCNYDGHNKHKTVIGDDTFIGSDTMMVAPVNIGDNVVVGAGSVITKDVPDGALAVARSREKLYDGWVDKHKS